MIRPSNRSFPDFSPVAPPDRQPIRWVRWLVVLLCLIASVGVGVYRSQGRPGPVPTTEDCVRQWPTGHALCGKTAPEPPRQAAYPFRRG